MKPRVLIVGGAGVFGRRLAEGVRATMDADLILAGRSEVRAAAAAQPLGAAHVCLDRAHASVAQIKALAPDIVVDAAGPFQDSDTHFARAVLEAGAHYVDLADARDFVAAFPALDAIARAHGKAAITGASSTPALTHAALDALCAGWARVDSVRAGIAPGNRAPKGRSVVAAILRRAGVPARVWTDGAWSERRGWSHCETIALDGLKPRRFALVETPDLDLIPARFAPTDSALFMAALELPLLHSGIEIIAKLREWGLWRTPQRAAGLLTWAAKLIEAAGSDRGAMFVEASGRDERDRPCRARWTLFAPAGRGPIAPTIPALAIVRKLAAGALAPGARACVGVLSLEDLDPDFRRVGFSTGIERDQMRAPFERALGDAFELLPAAVKAAHRAGPVAKFEGAARVDGAASALAVMVRACVGFPRAAEAAPVSVIKRAEADGSETWTRNIGGQRFQSRIAYAKLGMVREHFGPLSFDLLVAADTQALTMRIAAWRIWSLPLPTMLAPRSLARESIDETGCFCFDVPIALPLAGRITHYVGRLTLSKASHPGRADAA
jgi:saccharopine dehydrogenase-like NADP-dependent oxidoreductase